jgi:hypothetical protein
VSKKRLIRCLLPSVALPLLHSSMTLAAPVVDTSAPAATEFANAVDLMTNGFGVVPGSLIIAIRSAPSTDINPGLDGPEPDLDDGADTLEVAVVPVPAPSFSCAANTPVTVTISA